MEHNQCRSLSHFWSNALIVSLRFAFLSREIVNKSVEEALDSAIPRSFDLFAPAAGQHTTPIELQCNGSHG
jgi:hypothetical protein